MNLPPGRRTTMSGRPAPGIRDDARLQVEVDAVDEPGGLDDVAQLRLAPDPAARVVAEGGCERIGGDAQPLLRLARDAQLLAELAVLLAALGLEFGDLLLHGAQGLLHGRERLQHLALRALPLGALELLEASAVGEILELGLLVG